MEKKNITWRNINDCVNIIAKKLKPYVKAGKINSVFGIIRGGVIPAIMLSHKLKIDFFINARGINERTIIIDDIEDSGQTMFSFKQNYPLNMCCVLFNKRINNNCDLYAKREYSKKWLVFPWEVK